MGHGRSVYLWLDAWQWEALSLLAGLEHRSVRDEIIVLVNDGLARSDVLALLLKPVADHEQPKADEP